MYNIPFTYRVKCINTNEYYYGVKYAKNCKPSDLWSSYFTSSNIIKELILIHGKDNFAVEIRKVFDNSEDVIKWEQKVNSYTMNWPNYLNANYGTAFSKESCAKGARNFAKMYPVLRSEISRKAGIKASKTKDTGWFQTEKWRKLASRADYIWYADGKNNKRIHKNVVKEFELHNSNWKKGIVRENLKIPNNKGRIYIYSPDWKIKRFVHPGSDIYNELIKLGYKQKTYKLNGK